MNTPDHLKYATSHEWSAEGDDGRVTVGITDFAQDQLGDVVYVELPTPGTAVAAGDAIAVVESVKTASDIYAPVAGTIVEVNEALLDAPEQINVDPYGGGWIFRIEGVAAGALDALLDSAAYAAQAEDD
jgi:glycine cleavage system H protein